MTEIPQATDQTIEAMLKAIEDNYKSENRDYIGASEIGDPCMRKIWYNYHNFPKRKLGHVPLLAAESGHYAESVTADRLRLVKGIELYTHKPDGEQFGWERTIELEHPYEVIDPKTNETSWVTHGKISGHYDGLIRGLIQAPKAIHIWEHKDKDQTKFLNFKSIKSKYGEKNTLKEWDETYYGQAQINMRMAQEDGIPVNRHYLTVSYAGGRKYDSCRTDYHKEDAERLYNKMIKILNYPVEPPKLSEKPDFWMCRFCDFRKECHEQ